MKILQVVHQFLPTWVGGVEVYTHNLAESLIGRGHQVTVFVREDGQGGMRTDQLGTVPVHRLYAPGRSMAQRWLSTLGEPQTEAAFQQLLAQLQPDVVHFQHLLGLPAALFDAVTTLGIPTVATLHDYGFICANTKLLTNYSERTCGGPRAWINCSWCGLARAGLGWAVPLAPALAPVFALRDLRLRQVLTRANALVAPTPFVRDIYLAHGAPPGRLRVMEYGIEPPPIAPTPLREAGPLRVAYLGNVARLKGVQVLVEAFNGLPHDAELQIAGDLTREPGYVRQLEQRVRHPGVRFLGQQGRGALWALLDWADVVAVPSIWYEVSPLVIHEAFAMRRPVVASNLGSLAGRVRHEVDGILAPPGDSQAWGKVLQDLSHNRGRLLDFQQAIRPVKTAAEHAHELEELYQQLIPQAT